MFHILSKAWDIASKPGSSVIFLGNVSIKLESKIDIFEYKHSCANEYFFWLALFHMVAQEVNSLPVPAVVGIEIRSGWFFFLYSLLFSKKSTV